MGKLTGFFVFTIGFFGGSVSAYFALKKRFDILLDEEITSFKESYGKFKASENESEHNKDTNKVAQANALYEEGKSLMEIAQIMGLKNDSSVRALLNEDTNETNNLRNLHEEENQNYEKNLPKEHKFEEPYLIPPVEFNEIYGYETATLTLYSDGIIADEDLQVVDDADELLGKDNLQQLRDGEADCIYIRNDSKYCDYEVLRDYSTFEDTVINQSTEEE